MTLPIPIDDPRDPRIAVFRDIRERDITGRGGLIAEGTVVLDELLKSAYFRPTALLVLRSRLGGLSDRLRRVPPHVPVYVAESEVIDAIAGFAVHRGVLAHAERAEAADLDLRRLAGEGALVVVAAGISNHDNMGAIFRNAAAFAAAAVVLDKTACDPLYRKAVRVSVGAALTLPFLRLGSIESIADGLAQAGFACFAMSPGGQARVDEWRPKGATALFLGSEGPGLPPSVLRRMPGLRIAMSGGLDSLNVANAAAIALHHAFAWRGTAS